MEQFQRDYKTFESLIKTLLLLSSHDLIDRESKEDIDTFLLKEALEIRAKSFQPDFYWKMYESIAKRFNESFINTDFNALPFADDSLSKAEFLTQLWRSFFVCEIEAIIRDSPDFAILVVKAVIYPDNGWDYGSSLDEIIKSRYSKAK